MSLGEHRRACIACGSALASKGHYRVRFRSVFGDVPLRVRRWLVCLCQGGRGTTSAATLDFGRNAVVPELADITARYAGLAPFGKVAALLSELLPMSGSSTPARCGTGRGGSARSFYGSRISPTQRSQPNRSWSGLM